MASLLVVFVLHTACSPDGITTHRPGDPAGQPQGPFVVGIVLHDGDPVPNAAVTVEPTGLGSLFPQTLQQPMAGPDGRFKIAVDPGTYRLQARHELGISDPVEVAVGIEDVEGIELIIGDE